MEEKIVVFSDQLANRATSEVITSVGGKDLALNPAQISGLTNNFQAKVSEYATSMAVSTPVSEEEPVEPTTVVEEPSSFESDSVIQSISEPVLDNSDIVQNPDLVVEPSIVDEASADNALNMVFNPEEDLVVPEVNVIEPVMEVPTVSLEEGNSIEEEKPLMGQVEIVASSTKPTDYDILVEKISDINEKYDAQIMELNAARSREIRSLLEESSQKINENESKIMDLQSRAEEHLKNAQAAEQIATIAHQNAQNIQDINVA